MPVTKHATANEKESQNTHLRWGKRST